MTDEYDDMSRDELLFRLRDWRELAGIREQRIGELEADVTHEHEKHKVTWGDWKLQRERAGHAENERDRLRAVADAAHALLRLDGMVWHPEHYRLAEALSETTDQLDGSAEATDG